MFTLKTTLNLLKYYLCNETRACARAFIHTVSVVASTTRHSINVGMKPMCANRIIAHRTFRYRFYRNTPFVQWWWFLSPLFLLLDMCVCMLMVIIWNMVVSTKCKPPMGLMSDITQHNRKVFASNAKQCHIIRLWTAKLNFIDFRNFDRFSRVFSITLAHQLQCELREICESCSLYNHWMIRFKILIGKVIHHCFGKQCFSNIHFWHKDHSW